MHTRRRNKRKHPGYVVTDKKQRGEAGASPATSTNAATSGVDALSVDAVVNKVEQREVPIGKNIPNDVGLPLAKQYKYHNMCTIKEDDRTQPPDKKNTEKFRCSSDFPDKGTITPGQTERVVNQHLSGSSLQRKHDTDTTEAKHIEKGAIALSEKVITPHEQYERKTRNEQHLRNMESESRTKERFEPYRTPTRQHTQETQSVSRSKEGTGKLESSTSQNTQQKKGAVTLSEDVTMQRHNETIAGNQQHSREMQSVNRSKEGTGKFESSTSQHTQQRKGAVTLSEDVTMQRHNETIAWNQQHSRDMMFVEDKWSDTEKPYQIKPYQRNVPMIIKEFVLFCHDGSACQYINLLFLDNTIPLKRSSYCEQMFRRKVSFPSNYEDGITYYYKMKSPGLFFPSVNDTNQFPLDTRCTFRDCWNRKQFIEGILSHIYDICDQNLSLCDASMEIKTLPFKSLNLKETNSIIYALLQFLKEQSFAENKQTAMLAILHVIAETKDKREKICIPKEYVSTFLHNLDCMLHEGFRGKETLIDFVLNLCHSCFDKEHYYLSYLKFAFPFIGIEKLEKAISYITTKIKCPADTTNSMNIFNLLTKVNQSPSFEDVRTRVITLIIMTIPFDLMIGTYDVVFKEQKKSSEELRETVENVTLKRTEKILETLGMDKLGKFLYYWATILNLTCHCEPFVQVFETSFIKLVHNSSLNNLERFTETTKSILFASPESRKRLLNTIASSSHNSELFIILADLQEYTVAVNSLDPFIFKEWYYNSFDIKSDTRKRGIKQVCQKLNKILILKVNIKKREVVKIAQDILITELKKSTVISIFRETKAFDRNLIEGVLVETIMQHVSEEVRDARYDVFEFLEPFIVKDVLMIESRLIADIICLIVDKYANIVELSSEEQVLSKVLKMHRLCTVLFKCQGKFRKQIEGHLFYTRIFKYGRFLVEKLTASDINYKFMKYIYAKRYEIAEFTVLIYGSLNILTLIDSNMKIFDDEIKRIETVKSVLSTIKSNAVNVPRKFVKVIDYVKEREAKFYSGNITGNTCHLLWESIEQIPVTCLQLITVVKSVVFWNLLRDKLANTREEQSDTGIYLSENDNSQSNKNPEFGNTADEGGEKDAFLLQSSLDYIEMVQIVGLKLYKDCMHRFLTDNDQSMKDILHMFNSKPMMNSTSSSSKPDIDMEKDIAENTLGKSYGNSTWDGLTEIYSIGEIASKVKIVRNFLTVLEKNVTGDQNITDAFESFEKLLRGNVNEYTFLQVKTSIGMVFCIVNKLSEATFDIMASIGHCSSLIDFLRDILDEDIRNLIDAVEDISEQQVQESTVSGLIEIKQLLYPILKQNLSCQNLLNILEDQVKGISKSVSLPAKVQQCVDNIHNLRSLYNNIANRGEQTKQIVKNILDCGFFKFLLNDKTQTVLVQAEYTLNEKTVTKQRAELSDLRSRSLLLMNTDSKASLGSQLSRKQVETFVNYVDESIELAELYSQLHTSGHCTYILIDKRVQSSALLSEIKAQAKEYSNWEKELFDERRKHYLMNFIHGFGLQSMYQYLSTFENKKTEDKTLESAVQTILNFIHPGIKAIKLKNTFFEGNGSCQPWKSAIWLHCLGMALHKSYPGMSETCDTNVFLTKGKSETLKITNVVQKGKLFLAQLDENSLYTVKTVITLYANTVNKMPECHQVLFCTHETTLDEVELLIRRCLKANEFYKETPLYCIANVELLPSELYAEFLDMLVHISEKFDNFLLALVCRGTNSHQIIEELNEHKTEVSPVSDALVKDIFKKQHENVVTLTSDLAGMGKTNRVFKKAHIEKKVVSTFHISGTSRKVRLVERLDSLKVKPYNILHIDIGTVDDPKELDTFLFELLILRFVSAGRISVSLRTKYVVLEIANTINESLRNSLKTALLFSREHLRWNKFDDFLISKEIQSPVQIVCKYLSFHDIGCLDRKDINLDVCKPLSSKRCRQLLKSFFGLEDDLSFPVVRATLDVLADQLKKMTCSPFFKVSRLQDMTGNKGDQTFKSTLVMAMASSTKEFASRSVSSCRSNQTSTTQNDNNATTNSNNLSTHITQRTKGMIRWEDSNHLMFVFHCQNIQTLSPFYRDQSKVPSIIRDLFCRQMNKELQDFRTLSQEELQNLLQKIARNNPTLLPRSELEKIASGYALTPDNLLKMVLIMLRIKAGIPVIIMGETGCGKTSLVRYLASICEVHFDVLNIHAGVTEETIIETVNYHCSESIKYLHLERWLFLDEINTSESIGVMSEMLCHQKCLGKPIPPNLVVMGACNPYKLRSKKDIATAGLTIKSQNDELSRLVYRVLPLPEMMVDYVWDFGSLDENDEKMYIKRMVDGLFSNEKLHNLFSDLLSASQSFVRQKEASSYAVSLRDVNRCSILTKWFENILRNKKPLTEYTLSCDFRIRAMVLSLAHCYHCRFSSKDIRSDYRKILRTKLKEYEISGFNIKHDVIADMIVEEQKDFTFRMELPEGTACNSALMENVFVIIVCIYNRLPIFVVGKPGCSKSLAMQLIRSNLRGKDSKDPFFKTLQQLYCVSFQGSESSTSDGILKVFTKALNYQSSNSADYVLSVVILDEIGLAEVSRFNPLKVLHNLLEPNGEFRPHVAVVGLSNWSLDASKMNRAIHLSRPDMDVEELYNTAMAISESYSTKRAENSSSSTTSILSAIEYNTKMKNAEMINDIENELQDIAKSFHEYSHRSRFKNFHGLRDFYALVKYVSRQLTTESTDQDSLQTDTVSNVVKSGLERNFGGLPSEGKTLYEIFNVHFNLNINIKRNVLDLIKENVNDHISRHLLLVTCGDSSLGILEQQLNSIGRRTREVIFGSQFEEDLTDDYNYRILSRIILCMEEGMILILKDLENIYGSLYDMLNQNYTVIGNKQNCRVALGAYSNPICQVAKSFRCIVLMDETKVNECDPPFLNRFEKQYLRFSDILNTEQKKLVDQLKEWIICLKDIQEHSYDFIDMFPVYSEDLVPSLVLKTEREIDKTGIGEEGISLIDRCKSKLLWIFKPEAVVRLKRAMAPTIMLEADEIKTAYFALPIHCGLDSFISSQLKNLSGSTKNEGILTIVFTNSSMHNSLQQILSCKHVQAEKLGTFKSEKQVSNKIQQFWSLDSEADILIMQCSAVDDEKHILLTKSIIERHRSVYISKSYPIKHVYFVVHTPMYKRCPEAVSQLNFMSDWNLVMLDSLESSDTDLPTLCDGDILKAIENKRPLDKTLIKLLFWSFTRIKYSSLGRNIQSINDILSRIKQSPEFMTFLDESIWKIVSDMEIKEKDWQIKVACDIQALRSSSSFADALEQYIMRVIKIPLTKLIFCFEKHGLLESYFVEDTFSNDRRKIWQELVHDERLFSIDKIPDETGPECYACDTPDCSLHMPFSRMIFSIIERQRGEFIKDLSTCKSNNNRDAHMTLGLIGAVLARLENWVFCNIPDFYRFCYETSEKDYTHDFAILVSVTFCSGMQKVKRARYMEWIVRQKSDFLEKTSIGIIVRLHATTWMNTSLFRSEMQLLAVCEKFGFEKEALEHVIQLSGLECRQSYTLDVKERENKYEYDDEYESKGKVGSTIQKELNESFSEQNEDASSEESFMNAEDFLVEDICNEIMPTSVIVQKYGGVESWQRAANAILAQAAKVSVESDKLNKLRVCNEIAGILIIPMQLDPIAFYQLGDILHSNSSSFDSEDVFDKIVDIVTQGLNTNDKNENNCYRVFSTYILRCISGINTDGEILHLVFKHTLNHKIPDTMVHHFKAPLYCALYCAMDETYDICEESILDHFLHFSENKRVSDATDVNPEDKSCHCSIVSQDIFLCAVDQFIKNLKELDGPFVLLIVDLLTDLFQTNLQTSVFNSSSSGRFSKLLECHKQIIDRQYGVGYISAIAYIKAFISLLDQKQMWNYNETREYWKKIAPLLSEEKSNHINSTLLIYFMKCISKGLTVLKLKMFIDNMKTNEDFLEQINFSSAFIHFDFDRKPFCTLLNENVHSKYDLCHGIESESNMEKTLRKLISETSGDKMYLQHVLSFVFNERQLTKAIAEQKDEVDLLFASLTNEISEMHWQRILKHLNGSEDFKCMGFDMENSTVVNYEAQSFLIQLFIILFSHNEHNNERSEDKSVYLRCLTAPLSLKGCLLPGFYDSSCKSVNIHENSQQIIMLATCNCGSRIAVYSCEIQHDNGCVFCSKPLTYETNIKDRTEYFCKYTENVWALDEKRKTTEYPRGLHPLTIHIMQLIVKGCLLGSIAFGFSTEKDVKEIVGATFTLQDFFNDINEHWKMLSELFNLDDPKVGTLLRLIVLENHEYFCGSKMQKSEMENEFESRVKNIIEDRSNMVRLKVCQHNELHAFASTSFESLLTETNDINSMPPIERQTSLPLVFRVASRPTKKHFISEFWWQKSKYPFLDLILQFEDKLEFIAHIHSIIQWHVTTVANVSYMLKKHECLEMTVQELFSFNPKKREILRACFSAFSSAWTELRNLYKITGIGSKLQHIHTGTKLKECLLYDSNAVVYQVLEQLVHIQNVFLDKTLLIANKSEALHFLSVRENVFAFPCVYITEIRKEDLASFQLKKDTWDEILREHSQNRLEYGCGRETIYDFRKIETMFAMKLLTGKSYIDFRYNIPNIIFADNIYINYADLLFEIMTLIAQKSIPDEMKESIQIKANENQKQVKDLLTHLGMIMSLLKKTGGDAADLPLIDYIAKWSNFLSHEFPRDLLPNPETSIKLCHIIELNECLEEIASETVIDALQKEYTETIEDISREHIEKLLGDVPQARNLLRALKRFVYRAVFTKTADADRPISDYLMDPSFWPHSYIKKKTTDTVLRKVEDIHTLLPYYLMVRHVKSFVVQIEMDLKVSDHIIINRLIKRDLPLEKGRRRLIIILSYAKNILGAHRDNGRS